MFRRYLFLFYIPAFYIVIIPVLKIVKLCLEQNDFPSLHSSIFAEEKKEDESDLQKFERKRSRKVYESHLNQKGRSYIILDDSDIDDDDFVLEMEDISVPDFFISPDILSAKNEEEISSIDDAFKSSKRFSSSGVKGSFKDSEFRIFGHSQVKTSFGFSSFLTKEDAKNDFTQARARSIREDFFLEPNINLNIKGKIGKRVLVNVDFNQQEKLSENKIQVKYFALRKREFIREVTFGNIDFDFPESEFADFKGFKQKNKKTIGVESKFGRGKFKFHSIATLTRGESETETFIGKTRNIDNLIPEYQFIARKYFQLEPFIYYDGLTSPPDIDLNSFRRGSPESLITLTSTVSSGAENFSATNVNITPGSVEVWMDDLNGTNNQSLNARVQQIGPNSLGIYHRLQEGFHYRINYGTGRLEFIRSFFKRYKNICALYKIGRQHPDRRSCCQSC